MLSLNFRFVFIGISIILVIWYYSLITEDIKKPIYHSSKPSNIQISAPSKHILVLSNRDWVLANQVEYSPYFEKFHCAETSCVITKNRSYLANYSDYDAIVFLTLIQWDSPEYFQKQRADQIYVVANIESPYKVQLPQGKNNDQVMDYTMTYRLDSDIPWSYAMFRDKVTDQIVSPLANGTSHQWRSIEERLYNRSYFTKKRINKLINGKSQPVAWFVSNCNSSSDRMKVAKSLQNFINIDIYGRCGNLICSISDSGLCQKMLDQKYFFYLAFENAICKDYITEKVFRTMTRTIVPVVFGGADYGKFLPPHSYIDINDFTSTKHLADYLTFLIENREEYMKYFWWKEFYYIEYMSFCNLCTKLHASTIREKEKSLKDIDNWFRNGACTSSYKIKLDVE